MSFAPQVPLADRKLNIVVYGLPENPPNMNREDRLQRDVENVLSVIPSTDKPIDANTIKDCYHLGKYNSQSNRPRPLLVRPLRSTDASNILRNKSKLTSVTKFDSPIFTEPDLTPEERSLELLLLKERRRLIERGISHKQIKIRNYGIYIDNKPHCQVMGSTLQFHQTSSHFITNPDPMFTGPVVADQTG